MSKDEDNDWQRWQSALNVDITQRCGRLVEDPAPREVEHDVRTSRSRGIRPVMIICGRPWASVNLHWSGRRHAAAGALRRNLLPGREHRGREPGNELVLRAVALLSTHLRQLHLQHLHSVDRTVRTPELCQYVAVKRQGRPAAFMM